MNFFWNFFQNFFQKLIGIFSDPPFEGSRLEKKIRHDEQTLEELTIAVQENRKILEKLKKFDALKILICIPILFCAKTPGSDAITMENCPMILEQVVQENTRLLEKSIESIQESREILKSSKRISYWIGAGFEKKYTKYYTDFSPEFHFQVQIPWIYPMIGIGISASLSDFGAHFLLGIH